MANRTVKDAKSVHGTNPQYLIEKIIRTRIYESRYWKEDCFALSAELVVDKGIELRFIGGVFGGNIKPSPFLCLTLKMLQIQPDKDIIIEFISQDAFKYVRALGAFYLRLTATSLEVWKYLEPLYNDFRKLRLMDKMGKFSVIHMDEFVDMLLREDRVFDVILPRISKRRLHEEANELEPRLSALEDDLEEIESEEEKEKEIEPFVKKDERRDKSLKNSKKESSDHIQLGDQKRPKETSKINHRRRSPSKERSVSPSYRRRTRSRERDERSYKRDNSRERDRKHDRNRDHRGDYSRDRDHKRDHSRDRDHKRDHSRERDSRRKEYNSPHRHNKH